MGCDIHTVAEDFVDGEWKELDIPRPFDCRSYSIFGFLAGVRNYSDVIPISPPRGVPPDYRQRVQENARADPSYFEDWEGDYHSHSYLTLDELLSFDYDATTEDRRTAIQIGSNMYDHGHTCPPGQGAAMTYREFLGEWYFNELRRLERAGVKRIVFWFDS
jgi:hypothetical protein